MNEASASSQGKTPLRKEDRAKLNKHTINVVIPKILASDPKSTGGIKITQRIENPSANLPSPQASTLAELPDSNSRSTPKHESHQEPVKVTVKIMDTLLAAQQLSNSAPFARRNVAVLNMASPLNPGGGIRTGATSQEESLCARTTLLPSLKDEWYRLPDLGGIWTPDVCVFKMEADSEDMLPKTTRFRIDVITSAMLRMPDTEYNKVHRVYEYVQEKDRDMARLKIRALFRILQAQGVERVVLGAWGCGAYGNPTFEVAKMFRNALDKGEKRKKGENRTEIKDGTSPWGFKEVVFAIKDEKLAQDFALYSMLEVSQ
jgi:uncharacterized protein (TIGR02452 family)